MPRVRRLHRRRKRVLWTGECPRADCPRSFRVDAELWMQKIHVLLKVKGLERDAYRHLHGQDRITAYLERGGE